MIQILQPFEIANRDTASVAKNVREELYPFIEKDLLCFHGGGAIGCFHDEFGLEFMSVGDVDCFF